MTSRPSPPVRRHRLGIELRRLRDATGLKIEQVATALECAPSTVSRIENGQVSVRPRDLRAMLELYGVSGARQDELIQLARQARVKGWWHAHGDVAGTIVSLEAAAASIRSYEAQLVPGLLQTKEYARAVLRKAWPDVPADVIERKVQFRMARQAHVLGDDPPELWAVLDEAVLRRPIGGRATMREQLHRLVLAAERPTVRLQVLPFSVGEHTGIGGSFTVVSFTEPDDHQVVYLEQTESILYSENTVEIGRYTRAFEGVQAAALGPQASGSRLAELQGDYTTADSG
jgi:transcriptional regulator with XRE-family HTH domain